MNYIGDPSCKHNACNPHFRCAINPCGPCSGCTDYAEADLGERLQRRIWALNPKNHGSPGIRVVPAIYSGYHANSWKAVLSESSDFSDILQNLGHYRPQHHDENTTAVMI